MIKIISYMAILLVVVLTGLNLAMSHALATDGERLTKLGNQLKQIQEEVDKLEGNLTETQSINSIVSRAKELGFTESAKQRMISIQHLAEHANAVWEK